ncbi:MAG: zinc ribbon domain-containing protein, partial [Candidatus Eiseniibacteriota bacterium]
ETKILESYDREERLNAAVAAAERRLKDEEAKLSSEADVLAREEATLEQRIHSISQDRDAVKPLLPATLLSRYDRLLSALHGVAVAEIRKDACGACFKALTPHALQEARRGDQVKICEACGRILVYSETPAS